MTRSVSVANFKAGITRLRVKGGATPDSLYDLLNGYITASRSLTARPASVHDMALPAGTKGLAVMGGKRIVFASFDAPLPDPRYRLEILQHPTPGSTATLADIHFATPYLGFLYVAAEWSDGLVRHYWLQSAPAWVASTGYTDGAVAQPGLANGWTYVAKRAGAANPAWTPKKAIANGDVIEPTVPNGLKYTAAVSGAGATTGLTEPAWPTTAGATVVEVSA